MHVAARAGHPAVLDRVGGGRLLVGHRQHDGPVGPPDHRRQRGRRPGQLHGAVRPGGRAADDARRGVQLLQRAGAQVVAVQLAAGGVVVADQQRRAVGVEAGRHVAGQVEHDLGLGVGLDVPDQQLLAAAPLVPDQQPPVVGQRTELQGVQAAALAVPLLGDDGRLVLGGVGGAEHPQRRVARVAVLGVRDDEQLVVAGEGVDRRRVGVPVDHPGGAAGGREPQLAAVVGRPADRHQRAAHLQPGRDRPARPRGRRRRPGRRRTAGSSRRRTRRRRCRRTTRWSRRRG